MEFVKIADEKNKLKIIPSTTISNNITFLIESNSYNEELCWKVIDVFFTVSDDSRYSTRREFNYINLMVLKNSAFADFARVDLLTKEMFDYGCSDMLQKFMTCVDVNKTLGELNDDFGCLRDQFVKLHARNTIIYPKNMIDLQYICLVCMMMILLRGSMYYEASCVIQREGFSKIDRKTRYGIRKSLAEYLTQLIILTTGDTFNAGIDHVTCSLSHMACLLVIFGKYVKNWPKGK